MMFKYDVFLSHSSADKPSVEHIGRMLIERSGLRPFLDRWHLVPGASWQPALDEAIGQSATVAVFFGPGGAGPWHNEEMQLALAKTVRMRSECRIIPVLLPGSQPEQMTGFLSLRTWVDFRTGLDNPESLRRLAAGIKGEATESPGFELPDTPVPYRGLEAFQAVDEAIFFGREVECRELCERLTAQPLVAVVGCSGSGKSSLVRAGVISALHRVEMNGRRDWKVLIMLPGRTPLRALAEQIATVLPPNERLTASDDLTARLTERCDGLRTALTAYLADSDGPLLLVVDQFEELFTETHDTIGSGEAIRVRFIENLADLVASSGRRFRVLLTIRADFLERALRYPVMRDLLQDHQYLLGELGSDEIRESVVRPAQFVGAFFESGLVDLILRDVAGQRGILPQLQHALYELWQARRGAWMTLDKYRAMGGVAGSLQQRAQKTLESLTSEQREVAKTVLLQMVSLGDGVANTRRRVARHELYPEGVPPERVDQVLSRLSSAEARLILIDANQAELTHESLIQNWPTLRDWLNQNRESLQLARQVEDAADAWDSHNRDDDYLWTGSRLGVVEDWARSYAGQITAKHRAFLTASVARRDNQLKEGDERRRRQLRVRNRWIGALSVLCVGSIILAIIAGVFYHAALRQESEARRQGKIAKREAERAQSEEQRAHRETRVANSQRLAAQANSVGTSFPIRRLLLAAAAVRATEQDGLIIPVARQAIYDALLTGGGGSNLCRGITDVFASSDGRWLLTAGEDTKLLLWDLREPFRMGSARELIQSHPRAALAVAFSSNGRFLAICKNDTKFYVWDLDTNGPPRVVRLRQSQFITKAAISSDGRWLVCGDGDSGVLLWDLSATHTETSYRLLQAHTGLVWSVAISPDGRWCATGASDGTARLWDLNSGDPERSCSVLSGHDVGAEKITFSPDGRWLLTVDVRGVARLWNPTASAPMESYEILNPDRGEMHLLSVSRDGRWIGSATADGAVLIWDLMAETPTQSTRIIRGINSLGQKSLEHIDSRWIVTATEGGVLVYDLAAPEAWRSVRKLRGHDGGTLEVGIGSGGNRLWTKGADGSVRVWELSASDPGQKLLSLPEQTYVINAADIRRSPPLVACACDDGILRLWRKRNILGTGWRLQLLSGHRGEVLATALSQDGRWLVTGGEDAAVRVWDLSTADPGDSVRVLRGHSASVRAIAVTPDGRWLVTGADDKTAMVWDLANDTNGKPAHVLQTGSGGILAVNITVDGRWIVTGGEDAVVRVWDLKAADPDASARILRGHSASIRAIAVTPDGRWLVTGADDKTAMVWDLAEDSPSDLVRTLRGPARSVLAVAITADGSRIVTGSDDRTVAFWDRVSNKLVSMYRSSGAIIRVYLGADQEGDPYLWFASKEDGRVTQWSPLRGNNNINSVLHMKEARGISIAASSDGRWLVTLSTRDSRAVGTARVWDLRRADPAASSRIVGGSVSHAALTPDGALLATGETDGSIRVWDLRSTDHDDPVLVIPGRDNPVRAVSVSPDGRWLVTNNQSAKLESESPSDDRGGVGASAQIGSFASSEVRLWDLQDPDPAASGHVLDERATDVVMAPDGRWLATVGVDKAVRLWDLRVNSPEKASRFLRAKETSKDLGKLAFSMDGSWLAGMHNGRHLDYAPITLWDLDSSRPGAVAQIRPQGKPPIGSELSCFVIGQGRKRFLAVDQAAIYEWELESGGHISPGQLLCKIPPAHYNDRPRKMFDVSRNGRWLAVCHGNSLRLLDLKETDPTKSARMLRGHDDAVIDFPVFSSDGRWLAATSRDPALSFEVFDSRFVLLWDLQDTGSEETAIVFSELSRPTFLSGPEPRLLGWTGDSARLLPLDGEELVELALAAAGRTLSDEEINRFINIR